VIPRKNLKKHSCFRQVPAVGYSFVPSTFLNQLLIKSPMKMKNKIFAFAILAMGFSVKSFAQSQVTADASATIVAPISITQDNGLNFGSIAAGSTASDVRVTPAGARSITNGGNATLSVGGAAASAASFTVTGSAGYQYTVSLPADDIVTLSDGGTNSMAVNSFNFLATNNNATTGTGILTGGSDILKVGATLLVSANQAAGSYTGTFDVTVNYN
jgi:spore coat protein U-like protein